MGQWKEEKKTERDVSPKSKGTKERNFKNRRTGGEVGGGPSRRNMVVEEKEGSKSLIDASGEREEGRGQPDREADPLTAM